MTRRHFLYTLPGFAAVPGVRRARAEPAAAPLSDFARRLVPIGRILELENWYVWCCSAIDGPDGRVHVYFSRWPASVGFQGWLTHSEVAHAVADRPEGPYRVTGTILKGRGGGAWDADMIHNPTVHHVGNRYALLFVGNSAGRAEQLGEPASGAQRIGLAMADSLDGPWHRVGDEPLLDVSPSRSAWDSYITVNPALLSHPNGQFWLYYKAWDKHNAGQIRKIGLAMADRIEGPYRRHPLNPLIDFSSRGVWLEDPYVFIENDTFHLVARDHGYFTGKGSNYTPTPGLMFTSDDGVRWSQPAIAFDIASHYFNEPGPLPPRGGRFERPQILMREGRASYLFVAYAGGRHRTSSAAVFRLRAGATQAEGA